MVINKLALLLFMSFLPAVVSAGRQVLSLPLIARSTQWAGGGMTGTAISVDLSFVNISNVPQSVTIRVVDETIDNSIATSTSVPGWTSSPGSYWRQSKVSYPGGGRADQTITVPALQSVVISLPWNCTWNSSGANCDTSVTIIDAHTTTIPAISGASLVYQGRIIVSVQEDRGALIGRVSANVNMINAVNQIAVPMDYQLNGGKPF